MWSAAGSGGKLMSVPDFERVCSSCAHWKSPSERDGYNNVVSIQRIYDAPDYKRAVAAEDEADKTFGECLAISLRSADIELDAPIPLAVVRDGSDYMATLYTRGEFGCALFAALSGGAS